MKVLLATALLLAGLARCNKTGKTEAPAATAPSCIQQKIADLLTEPARTPTTRILRLTHNDAPAYYITAACCDQFSELYDRNCALICHPDGGITGRGDGRCPTLWNAATDTVEIWRDPRG